MLNRLLLVVERVLKLFGHCGVRAKLARDSATRPNKSNIRKLVLLDNSIPVMLVSIEISKISIIICDSVIIYTSKFIKIKYETRQIIVTKYGVGVAICI